VACPRPAPNAWRSERYSRSTDQHYRLAQCRILPDIGGRSRLRYSDRLRLSNPVPLRPMRLLRIPEPFDDPDFLYEVKFDGFRSLAHMNGHHCQLASRNGHLYQEGHCGAPLSVALRV
jgi:ATP-dependent DNA ligase